MLARTNALRAEAGLAPLARDARLDAAARTHSADMAWNRMLEHVSPRTGTPADRVSAAGVEALEIGENVAVNTDASAAQAALEESAPHKANMMSPAFTHVGLSVLRVEGGVWVTEVFAQLSPGPAASAPPPDIAAPPAIEDVAPPPPELAEADPPAAPEDAEPPPELSAEGGGAVVAGAQGPIVTIRAPAPGQRVAGYWVQHMGHWYFYRLPPNPQPGQALVYDPTVTGGPGNATAVVTTPTPSTIVQGRYYRVVTPPLSMPRRPAIIVQPPPPPYGWRAAVRRRHRRHLILR